MFLATPLHITPFVDRRRTYPHRGDRDTNLDVRTHRAASPERSGGGNRLATVAQGYTSYAFGYNGLCDRLRQTVNGSPTNYSVDLVADLTQVLSNGSSSYLYGVSRIGEEQEGGWQNHLGDALGSVRQLANATPAVSLARGNEPFGDTLSSAGTGTTAFEFTGEQRDGTGLTYLRARHYSSSQGRFTTRDTWPGDALASRTTNGWAYAASIPINIVDPTGRFPTWCQLMPSGRDFEKCVLIHYVGLKPIDEATLGTGITGSRGCYTREFRYRAPGYIEGTEISAWMIWWGNERVYSFARMEGLSFDFQGFGVSTSVLHGAIV